MKAFLIFDFNEVVKYLYLIFRPSSDPAKDSKPIIDKIIRNIEILNKNDIEFTLLVTPEYKQYQNFVEFTLTNERIGINYSIFDHTYEMVKCGVENKIDGSILLKDSSLMLKDLMDRNYTIMFKDLIDYKE